MTPDCIHHLSSLLKSTALEILQEVRLYLEIPDKIPPQPTKSLYTCPTTPDCTPPPPLGTIFCSIILEEVFCFIEARLDLEIPCLQLQMQTSTLLEHSLDLETSKQAVVLKVRLILGTKESRSDLDTPNCTPTPELHILV